jgi:hypothetical protein
MSEDDEAILDPIAALEAKASELIAQGRFDLAEEFLEAVAILRRAKPPRREP